MHFCFASFLPFIVAFGCTNDRIGTATDFSTLVKKWDCSSFWGPLDIIEQLIGDLFFDTNTEDCEDDVARNKKLP
jgi:hypothetical protein